MKRHLSIAKRLLGQLVSFSLCQERQPETSSEVGRRDYNIEVAAGGSSYVYSGNGDSRLKTRSYTLCRNGCSWL